MENDKFLGIDGIPIEFYKEFIETVKKDLQKTFHEILFTNKITPKTWIQAIVTLIPKKGDTNIISAEQNCSIPNRTISDNLFLIRDIMTYTKQKNNYFYLLQIDQ